MPLAGLWKWLEWIRRDEQRARWAAVAAFLVVMFGVLPFTNQLWRATFRVVGRPLDYVWIVLGLGGIAWIGYTVWYRLSLRGQWRYYALAGLALTYLYILLILPRQFGFKFAPADKLHFIEYGVLSLLIYRATRLSLGKPWMYIVPFSIAANIGCLDEIIQYFVPSRTGALTDVMLNLVAVALGGAVIIVIETGRVKSLR